MDLFPISHSIKCGGCIDNRPLLSEVNPLWEDDSSDEEVLASNEVNETPAQPTVELEEWDSWEQITLATTDIQTMIRSIKMPTGAEIIEKVNQTTLGPEALAEYLDKDF